MKPIPLVLLLMLALGLPGTMIPARSVQMSDGRTYFVNPPRLVESSTTQNAAYFRGARYYFTLTVPENAGELLQAVRITPQESLDPVDFYLNETEAFAGSRDREGAALPLSSVAGDRETQAITITFNPPVPAGRTVTVGLSPVRNPISGVYLYGVMAFPQGSRPYGQFLGYGRIHIYDGLFRYRW